MKIVLKGIFSVILLGLALNVFAQKADDVIKESSEPLDEKYVDDIVPKKLIFENRILPYEMVRESDIPWQKTIWRIIETREKMNIPFRHPERSLFTILKENIDKGNLMVFEDDEFKNPMTPEMLNNILYRVDTNVVYDPETYEETIEISTSEVNPAAIQRYRIKEMWYFDKEASVMKVRILGISPLKEEFDEDTGILKYEIPLFWIYYPESREYLAKERVFSDFNDAYPMTWYDLFETRFFSSYIIKASNVLDLRLVDVYSGRPNADMDILLESEKIKEELFNMESDLWSY
jgi:gliding motility associated protien GldN